MSESFWPRGLYPTRLLHPWDSPGNNTRAGCYFLLQGIFPTQELNSHLLHCRQIPYQLSYQGSYHSLPGSPVHGILQARILEWVAIPFSRGFSQPRNWTRVSWIAGGFFTVWATWEAIVFAYNLHSPPIYFKSSLDDVWYLVWYKFYINNYKHNINSM